MKKMFYALGLGLTLATSVYAADSNVDTLNKMFVDSLAPFQSETTVAKMVFNSLNINDERVLTVGVTGLYSKTGTKNKVELKVDNLDYEYGDGSAPKTSLKAAFNTDITKIISQRELDEIIPNIAEIIENFAKDSAEEFGDAITVKSVVTSTTKDSDGKYIALTGFVSFKFDINKLPPDVLENLPVIETVVSLGVNLKAGVNIDGYMISNPAYSAFKRDQLGLKEHLERLLTGDTETLNTLLAFLVQLDRYAEVIANGEDLKKVIH